MTVPHITGVEMSPAGTGPLLLLGPSLGTSAAKLWAKVAGPLTAEFHVVAWDLPGHGGNLTVGEPFTMAGLASGVLALANSLAGDVALHYAGDSVGGAVGLQLLLDAPTRIASATLISTGANFGDPAPWHERATIARTKGTAAMTEGAPDRWFAPGFAAREANTVTALLNSLRATDAEGYALVCEALADFDVRERLGQITAPVLAIAGAEDVPTPPASLAAIAEGVQNGRLAVLDGAGHLPPAEKPDEVVALLREHIARSSS